MTDLPIEKLLPKAKNSIYTLVSMAATRALELSEGRRCLAENINTEKLTTMALEEIAQGKIELKGNSSAIPPQDESADKAEEFSQEAV